MVVLLAMGAACAGPQGVTGVNTPDRAALDVARTRVARGSTLAARTQSEALRREPHWVLARYNPPSCDCPGFELFVSQRWVRVWLWDAARPDNAVQAPILEQASARGGAPLYALRVRLTGEARAAANDNEYAAVEVTSSVEMGELPVSVALGRLAKARAGRTGRPDAN